MAKEKTNGSLLTRAGLLFVALVAAIVDEIADLVEADAATVGALELALPAGQRRRHREDAAVKQPARACNQKTVG